MIFACIVFCFAVIKMNNSDIIDLCSDFEEGESNIYDGQKELGPVVGTSHIKEDIRTKEVQHQKSKFLNAFGIRYSNNMVSSPVNQSSLSSAPICRQFWKAGSYETVKGKGLNVSNQSK